MKRLLAALVISIGVSLLSGCDLAPVYEPPRFILPASYQGSSPFQVANPDEALSPRGDWWTLFGDEKLNQLEAQLGQANPTLAAAADAYAQARALAFFDERMRGHAAGETLVVISHGALCQVILVNAMGGTVEDLWLKERMDNCQISRLEWTAERGLELIELADVRHLDEVGSLRGWRTTDRDQPA